MPLSDEAIKECAEEVLANKTRSHVQAASALARWVLARLEKEKDEGTKVVRLADALTDFLRRPQEERTERVEQELVEVFEEYDPHWRTR